MVSEWRKYRNIEVLWLIISKMMFWVCFSLTYFTLQNAGAAEIGLSRILNGDSVPDDAYPFFVQIFLPNQEHAPSCGGTLIEPDAILTAAHCIHISEPVQSIRVKNWEGDIQHPFKAIEHPDYRWDDLSGSANDVALIFLARPWNSPVIPQPYSGTINDLTPVVIIGRGSTETGSQPEKLLMTKTFLHTVHSNKLCQKYYKRMPKGALCIYNEGRSSSCHGDSGSPALITDRSGQVFVAGISSFGSQKCTVHQPRAYTNVGYHYDWIAKTLDQQQTS